MMDGFKHTPGPWQNIGNCRIHGTPAYPESSQYVEGSEWEGVPTNSINEVCVAFPASVYGYYRGTKHYPARKDVQERWWERNRANISLICAAPDMLDDLIESERLFRWYGDLHAAKPDMEKASRNYEMADRLAKTIAKATKNDCETLSFMSK